ncbi:30S ribosome-binding factor RbfA [Salana multivorans]
MTDNSRAIRLGEAIKEIVATALETKIKDPRLGFVTVTGARVTGDLQHATVFYTVLGDEAQATASAAALESAKGLLRSDVGRQTGVKHTPTLTFQLDHTPQTAADIAEALRVAAARDAEIRAMAEGKTPAGDADPYKTRETADETADLSEDADLVEDPRD